MNYQTVRIDFLPNVWAVFCIFVVRIAIITEPKRYLVPIPLVVESNFVETFTELLKREYYAYSNAYIRITCPQS